MRTLADLVSLLSLISFAEMSKSGIMLPVLGGGLALVFNFKSRNTNGVDLDPSIEAEPALPILECRPGTYERFEIPRQHCAQMDIEIH
jgi:hypothetical protein